MKYIALTTALLLAACGGTAEQQAAPAEPVAASAETSASKLVFDLAEIVQQPENVVAAMLGEPLADCETGKYGKACAYEKDGLQAEVVFIGGKADWITLTSDGFKYPLDVPMQLGYDYRRAENQSKAQVTWLGEYGVRSMTAFVAGGNRVDYVYIKAVTE